jgi:hypothetical protein
MPEDFARLRHVAPNQIQRETLLKRGIKGRQRKPLPSTPGVDIMRHRRFASSTVCSQ